jgi:DnaJ like chaperone protein
MNFTKWIGAGIGWAFGGPVGAIIGMAVGSLFSGSNFSKEEDLNNPYEERVRTQSGDFELSLLILSSIVIKSDGKQDSRELDFVRSHFVKMYGKERANHAFSLFKEINKQDISKREVCLQIKSMMTHSSRLQLLHFLFGIAAADNHVHPKEVDAIKTIAYYLGISNLDFESIKAMFVSEVDSAYKILEIDSNASNEEIKKAYRKMVKKYHPDKLIHLGEEHKKGAEEKFRQVQEAYEKLQKSRDI